MLGVFTRDDALAKAEEAGLDLVRPARAQRRATQPAPLTDRASFLAHTRR